MFDARVRDFVLETGQPFPEDSLASVMRWAVDQEAADRMDEAGVDLASFRAVESVIKTRESRLRARGGAGAGKGPDAMVYGVSAPLRATRPCSELCLGRVGWNSRNLWANAAPPTQAAQPEQPGWNFNAFGKGKDKGEPRGPLHCYNCLGEGHPQFMCLSGTGAGKGGKASKPGRPEI